MIDLFQAIPSVLIRTSLMLAATSLIVGGLLWTVRPRSPVVHRVAWSCVLLQGLLIAQWSLPIEWYDPQPVSTVTDPFFDDAGPAIDRSLYSDSGDETPNSEALRNSKGAPSVPNAASISFGAAVPVVLSVVWLGGMVALFVFTVSNYAVFLFSLRRAKTANGEFQDEWLELLREQAVRRRIPLLLHASHGPMLCRLPVGYRVVVPIEMWSEFSATQRRAILRHELAHYVRGDIWKSFAARVMAVPHWFNPLAWWAVRKFEEGGEWACDQTLIDADPHEVPDFARALLALVVPSSRYVGASAARGGSLSVRLRRLLTFQNSGDSVMKRFVLFGALLCLVAAGFFRIHLVAREPDNNDSPQPAETTNADFEIRVADFVARIDSGDSHVVRSFKDVALSKAGNIVLRDRAGGFEEALRREQQTDAIPAYIEKHFLVENDRARLRDGQDEYRESLMRTAATFNEDVDRILPVVKKMGGQIVQDSEVDKLVARFLNHDGVPVILYAMQLRERLRPDESIIAQRLGELFVADENGQYVVRQSRRVEATEMARRGIRSLKGFKILSDELASWSEEMAEVDDLHKKMKKTFHDPVFAAAIGVELLENREAGLEQQMDQIFRHLEEAVRDTGDGLVIRDEARSDIEDKLKEIETVRSVAAKLKQPLRDFASKIRGDDEVAKIWREMLKSDIACIRIAKEIGGAIGEPELAVKQLLGQVVSEGDDGKLHVTHDNPEEVTSFIQEMFRTYREARRKGRAIRELASKLEDKEFAEALGSSGGMYAVGQAIRRGLTQQQFDGFKMWIDEHFESDGDRLVLRQGSEEEIRAMLDDVKNVDKELSKDDF